jgi:hypothetical protein
VKVQAAASELGGAVALVSVTGPGQDWLPWDASGKRVQADVARVWNGSAPLRWSAIHRQAARAARREAKVRGVEWRLLVKVWEYQKRGILHLHLLVPAGSAGQLAASEAYVRELVAAAPGECFGFVDRGRLPARGARQSARRLEPVSPHRAAAYVAAYVASTGAGKGGIAEVARSQGVPGAIVYVAQPLLAASGVTMRSLRARRRVVCQHPGAVESPDRWRAACLVDALQRRRAPLSPAARAALAASARSKQWTYVMEASSGELLSPTLAPLPRSNGGAAASVLLSSSVGVVRLDTVLNHGHGEQPPGCTSEVLSVETRALPRHERTRRAETIR